MMSHLVWIYTVCKFTIFVFGILSVKSSASSKMNQSVMVYTYCVKCSELEFLNFEVLMDV